MSSRLRRAFRYPSDDEDSDGRHVDDELDDEQQEAIVSAIRDHDETSIKFYKVTFTALPLLAILLFIPSLWTASTRKNVLVALLATTCLASTAYTMHFIPVVKDSEPMGGRTGRRQRTLRAELDTPVSRLLPRMNGGLATVLALFGVLFWSRGDATDATWAVVPGVIYAVVMVARHELIPMDLEALERSRYQFKGA